jgi:hypothetical protein
MGIYAGLDVSLEAVAICVVCETGELLWQGKALGEPEAVSGALRQWRDDLVRVGLEASATSEWIAGHLVEENSSACHRRPDNSAYARSHATMI